MRIVHAASEMYPFIKTGGLADVCGSLSKALAGFGHEVSFFLPGYRKVIETEEFEKKAKLKGVLQIEMGDEFLRGEVYAVPIAKRLTLYVIRRDEFFDRSTPYGGSKRDYDDNDRRFIFFCKAVVDAIRLLDIKADVLHCHDWQTGLAPLFLRLEEQATGATLALKTFFTIHNLAFQGLFPAKNFAYTNLPDEFNALDGIEFYEQISMIKGGIFFADMITTVSPNYAKEILTPKFGCGLEGALQLRGEDLVGIANGVDTEEWDPARDRKLPANYSAKDLAGKLICRSALLEKLGLPHSDKPVYGMIARLTQQKGVDLLLEQMDFFIKQDCRLAVLGKGDAEFERALKRHARNKPNNVGVSIVLDEEMSHLVEAGSDYFLMPSNFEPCGLNQMYSQRYGTIPIVSNVGGLADTVIDIASNPKEGTGIIFEPNATDFAGALARSLELFEDRSRYSQAQQNGMARDFSWLKVARTYESMYESQV